jgi:hypothetical protein
MHNKTDLFLPSAITCQASSNALQVHKKKSSKTPPRKLETKTRQRKLSILPPQPRTIHHCAPSVLQRTAIVFSVLALGAVAVRAVDDSVTTTLIEAARVPGDAHPAVLENGRHSRKRFHQPCHQQKAQRTTRRRPHTA